MPNTIDADPNGHDARFWDRLVAGIPTGALVLFDLGFTDFAWWATLTARGVTVLNVNYFLTSVTTTL